MHAREFLLLPVPVPRDMGSFDCVVVRFANDHFGQDDKAVDDKAVR